VARLEPFRGWSGGLLPVFLAAQHGGESAAAVVGHTQSRRFWSSAERAQPVSRQHRVLSLFRSGAHRYGGFWATVALIALLLATLNQCGGQCGRSLE
jgi:hypothetical protein